MRSWIQVVLSAYPPLYFLKYLSQMVSAVHLTSKLIFVSERVYLCLLSFLVDFCIYKYFMKDGVASKPLRNDVLVILASSSVMFLFACRSFTNTLELVVFSFLFLPLFKQSSFKSIIFFSFIPVLGTFIRPTFIFFAFVPYLQRFYSVQGAYNKFFFISKHVFFSVIFSIIFIIFDSYSYNFLKPTKIFDSFQQHGIFNFIANNVTITPINFILYNSDTKNLALHGVHSQFTHSTINVFILFNSLIFIPYKLIITNLFKPSTLPNIFALSFWLVPLFLLSIFPHQEFRFLIPLLLPLTIFYAHDLCKNKTLLSIWFLCNLLFSFFYGFIHQGGLLRAMLHMRSDLHSLKSSQDVHLFFWRSYMPPQHLLLLPSHKDSFFCRSHPNDQVCSLALAVTVEDLAGLEDGAFVERLSNSNTREVFVYTSGSVLKGDECEVKGRGKLVLVREHWPHFSGEDLFFEEPTLTSVFCNSHTPHRTLNHVFLWLFNLPAPHLLNDFIDRTTFKVFKLQQSSIG